MTPRFYILLATLTGKEIRPCLAKLGCATQDLGRFENCNHLANDEACELALSHFHILIVQPIRFSCSSELTPNGERSDWYKSLQCGYLTQHCA